MGLHLLVFLVGNDLLEGPTKGTLFDVCSHIASRVSLAYLQLLLKMLPGNLSRSAGSGDARFEIHARIFSHGLSRLQIQGWQWLVEFVSRASQIALISCS